MPSLRDLIPANFFIAPPVAQNPAHGRIDVCGWRHLAGSVLVSWERKCPFFDRNLVVARTLKAEGLGTYNPDAGGWVFRASAAKRVHEAFEASLVRTPAFLALLEKPAPAVPATPPAPERALHGTITWDGRANAWLVGFGNGFNVPRDRFAEYLDAARGIKQATNSRGWDGTRKVWVLSRTAAGRIVKWFPAAHFNHPADLAADAEKWPAPADVDQSKADQVQADNDPDPLATRLLTLADTMLADL